MGELLPHSFTSDGWLLPLDSRAVAEQIQLVGGSKDNIILGTMNFCP